MLTRMIVKVDSQGIFWHRALTDERFFQCMMVDLHEA
ncbi:hypothetical protein PFLUOLIPICF7_02610 [Pseudomonas simiae]|nr:hypothetical protein PFLUOLIPICF7_02610 [Pseudomonas simiae]